MIIEEMMNRNKYNQLFKKANHDAFYLFTSGLLTVKMFKALSLP